MDQKTLANINLFAVLGSLEHLCRLDPISQGLIAGTNLSIGFAVRGGPSGTFVFQDGGCTMGPGAEHCQVKLPFSSCEKFNGLLDGTTKPFPSKGFTRLGFLLHGFTQLTDRLSLYLRPDPADLEREDFFTTSTTLMLHLIVSAVAQVGNTDPVGRASAGYIQDGTILVGVRGGPYCGIQSRDHQLTALHQQPATYNAYMEFADLHLARQLFDGRVNAVACVGQGQIRIGGLISQVDNLNRILDRVALYLA